MDSKYPGSIPIPEGMVRGSPIHLSEIWNQHFLNPFFGILIAATILGEAITFMDTIGVIIITMGILAVQLARIDIQKNKL